jgi:uncharacterized membrane protein
MKRRDADFREETSRIEAFSDGVFAIAMTLLILEIRVPEHAPVGRLVGEILERWPSYLAFVASFFTIGVMWMNHHRLFNLIGKTDQALLAANLLLLAVVTFIPFPTALIARNLNSPDARAAAVFYNLVFVASSLAFQLLWRHASGHGGQFLEKDADPESVAAITRQYRFGPLLYIALTVVAYFNAVAGVLLNLALAGFFAIPSNLFKRPRSG